MSVGFRADPAWVELAAHHPDGFSSDEWGVPLSSAESADLADRLALRPMLRQAIAYARGEPDYAGMVIDQLNHAWPIFWFTGRIDLHRIALAALIPGGIPFDVRTSKLTLVQLGILQASIAADLPLLADQGIPAVTVESDPTTNSVVVGLSAASRTAETTLRRRYGAHISTQLVGTIEPDSCTGPTDCGGPSTGEPWKGGLRIHPEGFPYGDYCTSTSLADDAGTLVVMTAGHCLHLDGGLGQKWEGHGNRIGAALSETWHKGTNADVGLIGIQHPAAAVPRNEFLAIGGLESGSPCACVDVRSFHFIAHDADQQKGDFVCRAGANSGYWCGTIIHTNADLLVEGKVVHHSWAVDFDGIPGDSGGPYFLGDSFYGLHTDSLTDSDPPGGSAWYSTADWIKKVSGVNVCVTVSC